MISKKDELKKYIVALPAGTVVHVYSLEKFTENSVDKRKYIGHLLWRLCTEEHLLEKTGMMEQGAKTVTVYQKKGEAVEGEEEIAGHPLQHFWKGVAP